MARYRGKNYVVCVFMKTNVGCVYLSGVVCIPFYVACAFFCVACIYYCVACVFLCVACILFCVVCICFYVVCVYFFLNYFHFRFIKKITGYRKIQKSNRLSKKKNVLQKYTTAFLLRSRASFPHCDFVKCLG